MARSFDDTTRRNIAELCAAFTRAPLGDTEPELKRAAVAIALTEAAAGGGTTFLLTRRAATLRSHAAQWALPGGRCDPGETRPQAALRELHEETNIRSVKKLGEIGEWLTYDLPGSVAKQAWGGKYRGQKQKWYALRFTGNDGEIDIAHPGGGHKPEFVEWRWVEARELPDLVVPFKRHTYERVVKEFGKFSKS